jgi:hypothetical protein
VSADATVVGYCRACGKALDANTVRHARGTIYCEDHLPVDSAMPPPVPDASPYTAPAPPPVSAGDPAPAVAFLLGFIPGVGAIYNGQYAKGLIHVIVLGLLFSLATSNSGGPDSLQPLFVLMIIGFWLYMPFEAFHTAKRRRGGQMVDEFSGLVPARHDFDGGTVRTSRIPAGPVVLIILGVVFLLENLGLLELRRIVRFWPVLLILLGFYMLFERFSSSRSHSRSQGNGQ